ncbi:terminal deoxynucleotidyl transferas-like protein [Corynespora cassiicola Philippines]|uniref:DNA polymerase lambda n=1 Tax=Corynespora cassiicola Philippines TaxID=1448308 RepID=A0A2T2P8B1_CORCC|nr:terminal deoxynucleotidyl transferas-like protein [Corynespora cassiicola Philippines]
MASELTTQTAPNPAQQKSIPKTSGLDLSTIPQVAVLPVHFRGNEAQNLEEKLHHHNAPLTPDLLKVKVFIGKVGTKARALFELRSRRFKVEDTGESALKRSHSRIEVTASLGKRRRVSGSSNNPITIDLDESRTAEEAADESETEDESTAPIHDVITSPRKPTVLDPVSPPIFENRKDLDVIWVVKMHWLDDCIAAGYLLPLGEHLVYKGRVLARPATQMAISSVTPVPSPNASVAQKSFSLKARAEILDRAKSDASCSTATPNHQGHIYGKSHPSREKNLTLSSQHSGQLKVQMAQLLQQSTSENEGEDSETPPPPDWVKKGLKFSCQRYTPANGPNNDFIEQLKTIRTSRTLILDEIGVRAYSTIIASIAAYPYKIMHPREIIQLPGCDEKTCRLFVEWKNTNMLKAVEDFEADEAMKVLRLFYNIWGIGAKTARHFFYDKQWTELDDVIEFGWNDLDRVQQIGVKYYDEFLDPIPRAESEQIAAVVREHAVRLRDERVTVTITGGYRRGKDASGDVDLIVSHPDLDATAGLVEEILMSLENEGWVTHILLMSLHNTHRGQSTLPFRTTKAAGGGHDSLDKGLVVWQDTNWETREQDLAQNPQAKNPNIHRRVDIIISPWRTVGCAIMGWSGGIAFQRDLRRYAKYEKAWKFDSSGIRSRSTGEVVRLEGPDGVEGTPEDAERKVFEGLGLEYIPPQYRCTN